MIKPLVYLVAAALTYLLLVPLPIWLSIIVDTRIYFLVLMILATWITLKTARGIQFG